MQLIIQGGLPLKGEVKVPADKSITHRSLMFSSIADGTTDVLAESPGEDNFSTAAVMRQLGVSIDEISGGWRVHGVGKGGLVAPSTTLDCGNSGTTIRLLSGLLCGAGVSAVLAGDDSLGQRPMGRVCNPLRDLSGQIQGSVVNGKELPPLVIQEGGVQSGSLRQSIASAQVKSCVLLAGLMSGKPVSIWEPALSRDHSERLLNAMGVKVETIEEDGGWAAKISGAESQPNSLGKINVPGDISSAAFWASAALLIPGSDLSLVGVGLNPSRTGCLDAVKLFGFDYDVLSECTVGGEEVGTLRFTHGSSVDTAQEAILKQPLIPRLIDELVVLGALAMGRSGSTVVQDANELRVKESDRVVETARVLRAFGAQVEEREDGYRVDGGSTLKPAELDVGSDHRIALTAAVLGAAAPGTSILDNFDIANVSYPSFLDDLQSVGAQFEIKG